MKIKANSDLFEAWITLGKNFEMLCRKGASIIQNDIEISMEEIRTHNIDLNTQFNHLKGEYDKLVGATVIEIIMSAE